MNNRRSFFKSLIGLIVAPKVAEALPAAPALKSNIKSMYAAGIVYAPYMPLLLTPVIPATDFLNLPPLKLNASADKVYYPCNVKNKPA